MIRWHDICRATRENGGNGLRRLARSLGLDGDGDIYDVAHRVNKRLCDEQVAASRERNEQRRAGGWL